MALSATGVSEAGACAIAFGLCGSGGVAFLHAPTNARSKSTPRRREGREVFLGCRPAAPVARARPCLPTHPTFALFAPSRCALKRFIARPDARGGRLATFSSARVLRGRGGC